MNQTEMLHQLCHEVLADTDIRAICKNRGLPSQAAASRAMLESLFLSDAGVAAAMGTLDRTEIALLHLLRGQDRPVDVTFFARLDPALSKGGSYGTFSQRYQGAFTKVKDQLLRRGLLLLALGPETASKTTKMERWQFALPVQFARHLPPLLESARSLSGEGDWRKDAGRERLRTVVEKLDLKSKDDRVSIIHGELHWGGEPFRAESVAGWQKHHWQEEASQAKRQGFGLGTLPPTEAAHRILATLEADHWIDAESLAVPLEIFSGSQLDAAALCESGWRWGLLARQEADGRMWYRPAPAVRADSLPEEYLTVRGDEASVDLDAVPYDVLETLSQISDLRALTGERPALLLAPNLVKLGRHAAAAALPVAEWLRQNVPAFRSAFEAVRQRTGKTILHQNLWVARVSDLSLKLALEKALGGRVVSLSEEYIAFPSGAVTEVTRLVAQMGHVVKEVAP